MPVGRGSAGRGTVTGVGLCRNGRRLAVTYAPRPWENDRNVEPLAADGARTGQDAGDAGRVGRAQPLNAAGRDEAAREQAGREQAGRDQVGREAASKLPRGILERLSRRVGREGVERYFAHQTRINATPGRLELTVSSGFVKALIEERFREPLLEAAREELAETFPGQRVGALELSVTVDHSAFAARAVEATNKADARATLDAGQASDLVSFTPSPGTRALIGGRGRSKNAPLLRLQDVVVGASNKIAFSAAERICQEKCPQSFSPLFIHGACGLGKTHLLQGIAGRLAQRLAVGRDQSRVVYTTAEAFTNEYIAAVKSNTLESFRTAYRRIDALCLDDVHFFSSKQATQGELLHTLDAIGLQGARVVLASDEHPKRVRSFSTALVSRFMSGMVVKIESPDVAMREELIRVLAARRGLMLEPAAVRLLALSAAAGHEPSVRDLSGDLTRVSAMAEAHPELLSEQGVVGAILVRKALGVGESTGGSGLGASRRPLRPDAIIDHVCKTLRVEMNEITGRGRHPRVVLARSASTWLCRALTTQSFPEIARALGRPNHSTVVTAHQRIIRQAEAGLALDLGRGVDVPELAQMNVKQLLEHLRTQLTR